MPSAGTRVYPCRIPPELVEDVECAIANRNEWSIEAPWTFSDFLRIALREKLDKMIRSRRKYGRRKQHSRPPAFSSKPLEDGGAIP